MNVNLKNSPDPQVLQDKGTLLKVKKDIPIVCMEDFEVVNMDDKLNLLMSAINKINTNFHHKFEALEKQVLTYNNSLISRIEAVEQADEEILARVDDLEGAVSKITTLETKIKTLEEIQMQMHDELAVIKGVVQVQDKVIHQNKMKVVDLMAQSMANNIVITGICEDVSESQHEGQVWQQKENCKEKVLKFLREKLEMEVQDSEVAVAHRPGKQYNNKPRAMIVCCELSLRERIFGFTKNLKDQVNENGDSYYVRQQLPEPLHIAKKEREDHLKSIRKANEQIPEEEKHKRVEAHTRNNMLYINKIPQKKYITPPMVHDIFCCDRDTIGRMEKINFSHSMEVTDKGSRFIGHAARVKNSKDVAAAYRKIRLLYPESDHIMVTYSSRSYTGYHDDGEHGAGTKMLQALLHKGMKDVVVFVSREYGGAQLGQRRFLHIEKCAREAMNQ